MKLDAQQLAELDKAYRTLLVNSLTGFKSANLIGTTNAGGHNNLAIFSSLFHLGADPALIGMVSRPHSVTRDTLENIQETGYYSINHVNSDIYRQSHQTAARYPADTSEFNATGLDEEWIASFPAPFVKQSRIQLGLKYRGSLPVELNDTEIVIGEICLVNIKDDIVCDDGYVDIESADTVAVSSLDTYHLTRTLDSLSYAKPGQDPQSIAAKRLSSHEENS